MIDGIAVIDKPAGMTSHDVVAKVRRGLGIRKVGHAGTLDPSATGVLVLGIGRATRLLGFLAASEKTYEAVIRLGMGTHTDDADGTAITRASAADLAHVTDADVRAAAARLVGTIDQVPSAVSAVKQDGVRAHVRVRAGEQVSLAPRLVTITALDVEHIDRGEFIDVHVHVTCSAGTYVRALARDLGADLGVGGHVLRLHRSASGPFMNPTPLDDFLAEPHVLDLATAVSMVMPMAELDDAMESSISHGKALPWPGAWTRGTIGLVNQQGSLRAIVEPRDDAVRYCAVFDSSEVSR